MKKVVLYIRVSTDDQAQRGYSLNHQLQNLQNHCRNKEYEILRVFQEDFSARKGFDRPEWKNLAKFIKDQQGNVSKVLFTNWDRFSRNQVESEREIERLKKLGVEVESLENNFSHNNPEDLLVQRIMLTLPQVEVERLSRRTQAGMLEARRSGCYMGKAPRGYRNIRVGKNSTLEFSKEAPIIKQVFERMASGKFSTEETRHWLKRNGIKIQKNGFYNLIRNKIYVGQILIKQQNRITEIIQGLHPPLISEETFIRANQRLNGNKRNMVFHEDKIEKYPLKGLLVCPEHNRVLTGSKSKGNGGFYHYYQCTFYGCKNKRVPIGEAEKVVESILEKISVSADNLKRYKTILSGYFRSERGETESEIRKLGKEIEKWENALIKIKEDYLSSNLSPSLYSDLKDDLELKKANATIRLNQLKEISNPVQDYLNENVPILANILGFYRKSSGKIKNRLLGCIFSEKIGFQNGKNTTIPLNPAISVLMSMKGVLEGSKTKKEVLKDLLETNAPPAGLEPATL